ncbi:MAG: glutamate-cysteine ligase family protein [Candidatus Nanohalobium sp.]
MKIGLELEYWIADTEGRLVSSEQLAKKLEPGEQEFVEPLLELKTSPHEDTAELREEAENIVKEALSEARDLGLKIVPLGTPLNSGKIEMIETRRGQIQRQIIGQELEAAKRVAGTHIHFEILTAMDPALALMNSSPCYRGEKLASSSRNQVYRYRCYKNFPEHGQLWNYVNSVEEWEKKVEKRFQEFKQAGKENGINENEITEHFTPHDALWTPVRLRKQFPTIEWRAPDSGDIQDALRLAEESKQIMEKVSEGRPDLELPVFERLQKLSGKAIKKGLNHGEVRNYLKNLGFSPEEYSPYGSEASNNLTRKQARKIRLNRARNFERRYEIS